MTSTLTGMKEMQAKLQRMGKSAKSIGRAGVMAGAMVLAAEMRNQAPGRVKAEIGIAAEQTGSPGMVAAKAGIGVGRAKRGVGLFLAAGTKNRFRRTRKGPASTGRVVPSDFIKRAASSARSAAQQAVREGMSKAIERAQKG